MSNHFERNKKCLPQQNGPPWTTGQAVSNLCNITTGHHTLPNPKRNSKGKNSTGPVAQDNVSLTVRYWLCLAWRLGRFPELPATALEEGSKNESLKRFVGQHPGGRVFPRGPWREILDIGFYPPSLGKGV